MDIHLLIVILIGLVSLSESTEVCGADEAWELEACVPCPDCPPGQGLKQTCGYGEGGYQQCAVCPDGLFRSDTSLSVCIPCTDCSMFNREQVYSCRSVVDGQCGSCNEGFYDASRDVNLPGVHSCAPCTDDVIDELCDVWRQRHTSDVSTSAPISPRPAAVRRVSSAVIVVPSLLVASIVFILVGCVVFRSRKHRRRRHRANRQALTPNHGENMSLVTMDSHRTVSQCADSQSASANSASSTVPNGAVQHDAVPNSAVPYNGEPNSAVSNYAVPNSVFSHNAVPNSVFSHTAVPNSAFPHNAVANSVVSHNAVPNSAISHSAVSASAFSDVSQFTASPQPSSLSPNDTRPSTAGTQDVGIAMGSSQPYYNPYDSSFTLTSSGRGHDRSDLPTLLIRDQNEVESRPIIPVSDEGDLVSDESDLVSDEGDLVPDEGHLVSDEGDLVPDLGQTCVMQLDSLGALPESCRAEHQRSDRCRLPIQESVSAR